MHEPNDLPTTIYLIQSQKNGYVHVVFSNRIAAQAWMNKYNSVTDANRHPYQIVIRSLYVSIADHDAAVSSDW